jgi:16S rRNA processing protein RimM
LSEASNRQTVVLGKIAAAHGVRGQLKVTSYSGETATLTLLKKVMLRSQAGLLEPFTVNSAARHGRKFLISFAGLDSINEVLPLVGREIVVYREQLPELPDGEYYWCDLLGLQVNTIAGESLGKLTDIIATGSNDVYVVTTEAREYLVPALEDVVVMVDLQQGVMTINPPEGLFDL